MTKTKRFFIINCGFCKSLSNTKAQTWPSDDNVDLRNVSNRLSKPSSVRRQISRPQFPFHPIHRLWRYFWPWLLQLLVSANFAGRLKVTFKKDWDRVSVVNIAIKYRYRRYFFGIGHSMGDSFRMQYWLWHRRYFKSQNLAIIDTYTFEWYRNNFVYRLPRMFL
jgi:hypothetical protein